MQTETVAPPAALDMPTMWTRAEAAAFYRISLVTLDAWIKRGVLDVVKVGRVVRIRRPDLSKN